MVHANSKDSDQTARMCSLFRVLAGHTGYCRFGHALAQIVSNYSTCEQGIS